jgi:hypothetical protein
LAYIHYQEISSYHHFKLKYLCEWASGNFISATGAAPWRI